MKGMSMMDLKELLAGGTPCQFERGIYLQEQGARVDYVYYLVSGQTIGVMINEDGREYLINEINSNRGVQSITSIGLLLDNGGIATMGIVALTHVEAVRITAENLVRFLRADPDALIAFTAKLMHHYVNITSRFNDRSSVRSINALSQYLLQNCLEDERGLLFPKSVSHQNVAKYLGVHPVTMSRMLSALKDNGYIKKTAEGWRLVDVDGLLNVAQGLERVQYRNNL